MLRKRIGICAPSTPISTEDAERVTELATIRHPDLSLVFSDQCFASAGHFAGDDELRRDSFVQMANDPSLDCIWFARGGYGAVRIADQVLAQLKAPAHQKLYVGYSDAGNILAALYKAGIGRQAHGPMPVDIRRDSGNIAISRVLDWIVLEDSRSLDPALQAQQKYAAFNLTTLAMMAGTSLMPNLDGHVLMIEEVAEHLYALDRALFCVTSHLADAGLSGIKLGQVTAIPENDRPFGQSEEEITRYWCNRFDIPYLGRCRIGHDVDNLIVPFGRVFDG